MLLSMALGRHVELLLHQRAPENDGGHQGEHRFPDAPQGGSYQNLRYLFLTTLRMAGTGTDFVPSRKQTKMQTLVCPWRITEQGHLL